MPSATPDVEAYTLLRAGRFREALPLAERAVAGRGSCVPAHGLLATILLQLGRAQDADAVVAHAMQLATGIADAYDALAYVSLALGRHERANSLYRRAAEQSPETPRFWYNLACSERSLGRLDEAEAACDRAIGVDAAQFPSYLLRSELRVQSLTQNHVRELQHQLTRPNLDERAVFFLGFALGKELDDLQRYDEAFAAFAAAAAARRSRLQYDVAADEHKLRRIMEAYPAAPSKGAPRPLTARHVFIVGLPRSGTTLVERILTGLENTRSNGETEYFSRSLLAGTPAAGTPAGDADVFARAARADPVAVGERYMQLADPQASGDLIIEKLPMNYLYLGAIRRALPEAKILWVRRSPLDSCFAMYRTLFGAAYPFTYDFLELARYYAAYERLMNHWRRLLGDDLHEIVYEDLVAEPRRIGAIIAGHCNLEWRDGALDIQKNAAVSLTASASQVRRPIYGTSSGRWRRYHRHLGVLIDALRRHGVSLPPDA
jgi:tetratricopeptide (TPR) repeat protein